MDALGNFRWLDLMLELTVWKIPAGYILWFLIALHVFRIHLLETSWILQSQTAHTDTRANTCSARARFSCMTQQWWRKLPFSYQLCGADCLLVRRNPSNVVKQARQWKLGAVASACCSCQGLADLETGAGTNVTHFHCCVTDTNIVHRISQTAQQSW